MNRRHFLATIGAAALARRPTAVGATPTMADVINHGWHLFRTGADRREVNREFERICHLLRQTGPLVLNRSVVTAESVGNSYMITHSVIPFLVDRTDAWSGRCREVMRESDERLSELSGIPLASRTPVPA
jgi:cytochrome oxidase Cu insertion factor (SCO1/SenC/PrrC family)